MPADESRSQKAAGPVSFRFPGELAEFGVLLTVEASKRGVSPNDLARTLVVQGLTTSLEEDVRRELAETKAALGEFRREVRRSREDLATLAVALLVTVGGQKQKDAAAWVQDRLTEAGEGRGA